MYVCINALILFCCCCCCFLYIVWIVLTVLFVCCCFFVFVCVGFLFFWYMCVWVVFWLSQSFFWPCPTISKKIMHPLTYKCIKILKIQYRTEIFKITWTASLNNQTGIHMSHIGNQASCKTRTAAEHLFRRKGKEMLYLMMHTTHFIYSYMASDIW